MAMGKCGPPGWSAVVAWFPACTRLPTCSLVLTCALSAALGAQGSAGQPADPPGGEKPAQPDSGVVTWGPDGLVVKSDDGNYRAKVNWRLQLRGVVGPDDDPVSPEEFEDDDKASFLVRRARFKIGGHAIRPWLDYYLEYDFVGTRLLDYRITLQRHPWLKLRVGQWKVEYNRERRDSSGEQQFAERSIVNDPFTIDRQQGIMLTGRVLAGHALDSTYYTGIYTGMGRGGGENDDAEPMWSARYQWNLLREELPFSQSDVRGQKKPVASLSVATAGNRSPFTSFSSSGGSELPGFEEGGPGRYSVRQWLEEAALHYRGFSFQHEFHWKRVADNDTGLVTELRGSYTQAGFFVYRPEPGKPRGLELGGRVAFVDPSTSGGSDRRHELSAVANWFIRGHGNKVTFDVSRLTLEQPAASARVSYRARLQWDVQF